MIIYNSKSGKKEQFVPITPGEVSMYVCGPTLYSEIHIGNARPLIFFDVVSRYLSHKGYNVKYVSNITDIDDKIIDRSIELGITEEQLVADNIVMYNKVRNDLNLRAPMDMPQVTQHIEGIIDYIAKLIELGYAYESDGNVYFSVDKIEEYGQISNRRLEDLQVGARIENDTNKKYEHDFVLWKKTDKGIKWQAPFGEGRPGWHTECVVMINNILGQTVDIHGGGMDLKFPHHENEEAQSLACGCQLANIWMHNGFLNIDDTKMSKSLGNVIYPQAMIDQYGTNFVRLMMLRSSYRGPINISSDVTNQIEKDVAKLTNFAREFGFVDNYVVDDYIKQVEDEMDNDFNTANSFGLFIKLMGSDIDKAQKANLQTFIYEIFGFVVETEEEIPAEVLSLVEARTAAKKDRDFARADQIRDEIDRLGYEVKDTREGVTCHKK